MLNIFAVEDNSADRVVLHYALLCINEALNIEMAVNGEIAIEQLQNQSPDLIIIDINLPGISGWDVYDVIQKHPVLKKCRVVMLTGMMSPNDTRRANQENLQYIEKPFSIDAYIDKLRGLISTQDAEAAFACNSSA